MDSEDWSDYTDVQADLGLRWVHMSVWSCCFFVASRLICWMDTCQKMFFSSATMFAYIIEYNSFWNIHHFTLFPYKSIRDQIWPCRKIGQGQLRVIIWINLEVLEYPMLHTNFQGHWSFGSREEDFLRFLPCMGMAAILVMWHRPFEQTFVPLSRGGSTWNLASIGLEVSKKKKFENMNQSDLGWRSVKDLDLWYSYKFMYWFS